MVRFTRVAVLSAWLPLVVALTPSVARADDAPQVRREANATLEVRAAEPTAVTVASRVETRLGTTPLTLSLSPGSYIVQRTATEPSTRIAFELAAGEHRRVELPEERRSGMPWVWVALGVGVVALGATLGVVVLAQR